MDMNLAYQTWREKHALREGDVEILSRRMRESWSATPGFHLISVLQGGQQHQVAATLGALGEQLYPGWGYTVLAPDAAPGSAFHEMAMLEWVQVEGDFAAALDNTVRESSADWIALIDAGDRLAPHALVSLGDAINRHSQWRLINPDEDRIDAAGVGGDPRFKPDFNPDLLRSTPYMGAFAAIRRDALLDIGGIGWLAEIGVYEWALKVWERYGEQAIGHVPDVLFHRARDNERRYPAQQLERQARGVLVEHLQRAGVDAEVSPALLPKSFFVDYRHEDRPLVSIIVPTKDQPHYLVPCIESLLTKTTYHNYEVLIVDNNTTDKDALAFMKRIVGQDDRVRLLRYPHPYSFAAINNYAAAEARGEYLLLLNNDTVVVQDQWLERMMAHGQRPEVGIVGARLVFPDKTLQHAGVVVGLAGSADHPSIGLPIDAPGYLGRAQLVQNYSAVTAACLLVRKSLYRQVDGFDEQRFKVLFNDVDLCLKVGALGKKVVWTPYATLIHHGSVSLRKEKPAPHVVERLLAENHALWEKWPSVVARDPAYNPNLSLIHRDWRVETETDVRWDALLPGPPRIIAMGPDAAGSWAYRVDSPLAALEARLEIEHAVLPRYVDKIRCLAVSELLRTQPDVLYLHNTLHDAQLEAMKIYRQLSYGSPFMVFSQDDYVFELPAKNPIRKTMYKDMRRRMRRALSYCDRLIVTTEPLADACATMIDDIRIVPNYLERRIWGELRSQRQAGPKPRVGWAGAQQHQGDLELLIDVVTATADEVDWVFFGFCIDAIKPYAREIHTAVTFERYPAKLASLNLDLAVAPLEHHRFNEAKSNLRLLEYGILGWPVICADIEPYRGAPVQLVPNNARAWIKAIRDRIHEREAAEREGDTLRQWVLRGWMLEDHGEQWLTALLPDHAGRNERRTLGATGTHGRPAHSSLAPFVGSVEATGN